MRTTIDRAGRIVIPKAMRDEAGLAPGTEVDVELRDGRIEIEPAPVPMRIVYKDGHPVIEADAAMPPLTADDVRETLERTRR
jgi:AbrB family looped-hinge helix DNA binding protein